MTGLEGVGAAAGKVAGGLAVSLAKDRLWAVRASVEAFRKVPSPKPRRALAQWLKLPRTMETVLLHPYPPDATAAADLDAALSRSSKRWRKLPQRERVARAGQVAVAAHAAVLSVHSPGWALRIASGRQSASSAAHQETLDRIDYTVRQISDRGADTVTDADRQRLEARLRLLPPGVHELVLQAWDDAPADTWRLVSALTDPTCEPQATVADWEACPPQWLASAHPRLLTLTGELAAFYGGTSAARTLFLAAARAGAPRRQFWIARAAGLYDLEDAATAIAVLDETGTPQESVEPFVRALHAVLVEDWATARHTLASWRPDDPTSWAMWWSLAHRVAFLSTSSKTVDRAMLDATIDAATNAIDGALRAGGTPSGLSVRAAEFLIMRAQLGAADRPAGDFRLAGELALRARDDRRAWRGDSAEATAVACAAALAAGDFRRVVELGCADAEATGREAAHPKVRRHVVIARAALGEVQDAPDLAGLSGYEEHSVRAVLASQSGSDPGPHWRAALAEARDGSERVSALAGLAGTGERDLDGIEELEAEFPDVAAYVRARADLAAGDAATAISRLRGPARTSVTAAMTLGMAYAEAEQVDNAVATWQEAAERFGDPDLALTAVRLLLRAERRVEASAALSDLLGASPAGWAGQSEAMKVAAQLAIDHGDLLKAIRLLRTSLELDPHDARGRWALGRLLLSRGSVEGARRVLDAHPVQLEPTDAEHAHTWLGVYRRDLSPIDLARGALRVTRQFPDNEAVTAHAIIALVTQSGQDEGALPDELLAEVHAVQRDFFARWPDSAYLKQMTVDIEDPEKALADLAAMVAVDPDTARARRTFQRKVTRYEVPLGSLSLAASRGYAQIVISRGLGVLPAWHPDPAEHVAAKAGATESLDGTVLAETSALVVLGLLTEAHRGSLLAAFRAVEVADATVLDVLTARDALAARSTTTLVYDDRAQQGHFVEISEDEADRLADEAARLADLTTLLRARPDAATDGSATDRDFGPWFAACRTAVTNGTALWCDDAALRVLARSLGAKAFSTAALLEVLAERGALTRDDRNAALGDMVRGRVGGIPLTAQEVVQVAEQEGWSAGGAAHAAGSPALWANPTRAFELLKAVVPPVADNRPDAMADWAYLVATGIGYANDDPDLADQVAGSMLAFVVYRIGTRPAHVRALVLAVRHGVASAALDPEVDSDPLPHAASALYRALAEVLQPATATQYVLAVFSELDGADRAVVAQALLAP